MLPQTLPIRFLLNRRGATVMVDGANVGRGPASQTETDGRARTDFLNSGSDDLAPGAGLDGMRSETTAMRRLDGLAKALGLGAVWFKEAGSRPETGPLQPRATYAALVREILDGLKEEGLPTHFFAQAGNGEMAAAMAIHLREVLGDLRPRIIVAEPANADCILESALASRPTPDTGDLETTMVSLACREVSPFAWTVLEGEADAFLSISDYAAEATVLLLQEGVADDPPVFTRPAGPAGLAGLIAASFEPALTGPLALGPGSRVLTLGWEGPA